MTDLRLYLAAGLPRFAIVVFPLNRRHRSPAVTSQQGREKGIPNSKRSGKSLKLRNPARRAV